MGQQHHGAGSGLNVADIQPPNVGCFIYRLLHKFLVLPSWGHERNAGSP